MPETCILLGKMIQYFCDLGMYRVFPVHPVAALVLVAPGRLCLWFVVLRRRNGYDIIIMLPPLDWYRKGVYWMEVFVSLIVAVAAGVICHYIIKWLDGGK